MFLLVLPRDTKVPKAPSGLKSEITISLSHPTYIIRVR